MAQSTLILDPYATIRAESAPNRLVLEPDEGKSEISIKQVRELVSWAVKSGFTSGLKIAVILGLERVGRDAQHTLLKTLEEPGEGTELVLAAAGRDNVLPTILSRCATMRVDDVLPDLRARWGITVMVGEPLDVLSWTDFLALSDLERWLWMERFMAKKPSLEPVLETWSRQAEESLRAEPTRDNVQALASLSVARDDLKARIQPRLACDALLLSLS